MTGWKMRHLGATEVTGDLTIERIVEGVKEGVWDPADEVQSPSGTTWTALEMHPQFEEVMAELVPEDRLAHDEEARLDMNPLIDVALVLLIFFILTTTYEEMRKELPPPPPTPKNQKSAAIAEKDLNQIVIRSSVFLEGGNPVYRIAEEVVAEDKLQERLEKAIQERDGKIRKLAVEIGPGVPWRSFIALQDAATGAKIDETIRIVRPSEVNKN